MQPAILDLGPGGRYRLIRPIAHGAHAAVLLARPEHGGPARCVKRFHDGLAMYDGLLEEIHAAFERAPVPEGPGWVRRERALLLDRAGAPTLVVPMDHVDGGTLARLLARLLARGRGSSTGLALHVADGVLGALAELDRAEPGAVYQALESSHVLLSRDGLVALPSARASPIIHGRGARYCRGPLSVLLPPLAHFAPEQVRGLPLDARADLHAAGVLIFALLAGQHPYARGNLFETARDIVDGRRPALVELAPELPRRVIALVERLLAREPERRPRSAAEARAELRAAGTWSNGQELLAAEVRALAPSAP